MDKPRCGYCEDMGIAPWIWGDVLRGCPYCDEGRKMELSGYVGFSRRMELRFDSITTGDVGISLFSNGELLMKNEGNSCAKRLTLDELKEICRWSGNLLLEAGLGMSK